MPGFTAATPLARTCLRRRFEGRSDLTTSEEPLHDPRDEGGSPGRGPNDLRFSPWNLLLLLPLTMLITAMYNFDSPRLFGMPFFYWFQFAFVFVGVACVAIVYVKTRHVSGNSGDRKGGKR